MELQEQVCTRGQAVKLKELGIVQDGEFDWVVVMPDITGENYYIDVYHREFEIDTLNELIATAFTSAELGRMLAALKYEAWGHDMVFTSYISSGGWRVTYRNPRHFENPNRYFETEAEARADMLIFILTEKLMTAEEANNALTAEINPRRKQWAKPAAELEHTGSLKDKCINHVPIHVRTAIKAAGETLELKENWDGLGSAGRREQKRKQNTHTHG